MMTTENKPPDEFACLVGVWAIFVTTPMYLALMFSLMASTDQPVWAWVLFWCYAPAQVLLQVFLSMAKVMKGGVK